MQKIIQAGNKGGEEILDPEEEQSLEVMQTRGNGEGESDIDWEGIGNYGTDSDVENYIVNNEQTNDYGDLESAIDVEVYKAFGEEQKSRKYQGKDLRTFKDFSDKIKTPWERQFQENDG